MYGGLQRRRRSGCSPVAGVWFLVGFQIDLGCIIVSRKIFVWMVGLILAAGFIARFITLIAKTVPRHHKHTLSHFQKLSSSSMLRNEDFSTLKAINGKRELNMCSFQALKIRLLRSLSIKSGDGMQVLDFDVFPEAEYDLPIILLDDDAQTQVRDTISRGITIWYISQL